MLTKKEKETYDFIIDFQRKYGQFPLLTEIADGIGTVSYTHLRAHETR